MPNMVEDVESRRGTPGQPGEYRVSRAVGRTLYVYAKDELDAYTKAMAVIEKEEKEMRTFTVCVTVGILALLSVATYACESKSNQYSANMKHCIAAGKSYVSEDDGYSCRDPDTVLKPKEQA